MSTSLQLLQPTHQRHGKHTAAPVATTAAAANESRQLSIPSKCSSITGSHRLIIADPTTCIRFLIDTGSDVSILPRLNYKGTQPTDFRLFAANNTPINTYGTRNVTVSLGLRRALTYNS